MKRYQLRVPKNLRLEDVVEEMASKGWDSIIEHLDAERILAPLKNYRHFQSAIYGAITPHIHSFTLCGKPDFCTDEICMCRLDKRPKPRTDSSDRIFHLFVNSDLDNFVDQIVDRGFQSLDGILKSGHKLRIVCDLRESLETILTHYLYFNPVCGTTPFCEYSEMVSAAGV